MIEIVKSTGQAEPPKVEYSAAPITDGSAPQQEPAAAATAYTRAFSSPAQNSRTPGSVTSGKWSIHWQAPLDSEGAAVLFAGDRILVQRAGGWTLFDAKGKQIAEEAGGRAAITIDTNAGMFYSLGAGNSFQAIGLNDGVLRFAVPLGHNEAFAWPLLLRSGKRLVAVGTEQRMFSPKGLAPTKSLIQAIEVGSPAQLSPYKILLSVDSQTDLVFNDPRMAPVANGEVIWAVLPNLLVRTSPTQNIDGAWSDTFEPQFASADERGSLYLVVSIAERRELWIITPEGKRVARTELKPEHRTAFISPAVGYDHRVYITTPQLIAAFSPDGKHLWDCPIDGGIKGLSVTTDGKLVVAAGSRIHVVDSVGKSSELLDVGQAVTTPPVLTAQNELILATESKVICYRAGQ